MVTVSVAGDKAVFEVEGWHKFWSLKSRLEIPLEHIKAVHADPARSVGWFAAGIKKVGTDVPNIFMAGTFYQHGGLVFWDVRHPENTIIVDLEDEKYKQLIIEVEHPAAVVGLLTDAISK